MFELSCLLSDGAHIRSENNDFNLGRVNARRTSDNFGNTGIQYGTIVFRNYEYF
jgi:hypothetical protein